MDCASYDAANRLTNAGAVAYTWNANGNLLNDGVYTYTYDTANRLSTVTGVTLTASYAYNGQGDRLRQVTGGVTTTYTLDLNAGLTQVLADSGANTYLYGNGRIAQLAGSDAQYFLADHLGSVRQLTNASGGVTLAKSYQPYGSVLASTGSGASGYGFTGEWTDDYLKLTHLRARFYSSTQGRFLTKDSFPGDYRRPLSLNGWNYTEGNPINLVDPWGLAPCTSNTCWIMRNTLKPHIVSAAQRFNSRTFTNMTDDGFAVLLGAKLLFENRVTFGEPNVPGGQRDLAPYLGEIAADRAGLSWEFESRNRTDDLAAGRPIELSGVSYGVANIYINQSINAQIWWTLLGGHTNQYQGAGDYRAYNTAFVRQAGQLIGIWNQVAYHDELAHALEVWDLQDDRLVIERQALIMVHAGFLNYEGAAGSPTNLNNLCWGQNAGLSTAQISSFRIALVVRGGYGQVDPARWARGPGGQGQPVPDALRWVELVPTAAAMLDISAVEGYDYHSLTALDALILNDLGYSHRYVGHFPPPYR